MLKRIGTFIFTLLLLLAAFYFLLTMRYPVRYREMVRRYGNGLDNALVYAVIHAESKFKPEALSIKGAAGLMQLTDDTALWIAEKMKLESFETNRLFEPELNIAIGCYLLNWLIAYYDNDLTLALCAYNAGMGNVNKWLQDERYSADGITLDTIPFPETRAYIQRVEANKRIYTFLLAIQNFSAGFSAP